MPARDLGPGAIAGGFICLVFLSFIGCELNDRSAPETQTGEGLGVSLVLPPYGSHATDKLDGSLAIEVYDLGSGDQGGDLERPVFGDPFHEPIVAGAFDPDEPVILEIEAVTQLEHFRLFVGLDGFLGSTTFTLRPTDVDRQIYLVLADTMHAGRDDLVPYPGIATAGLGIQDDAQEPDEPTVYYPIGLANQRPLAGLDLRFVLSDTSSATIFVDPGSRLLAGVDSADPPLVPWEFHRLDFVTEGAGYRFRYLDSNSSGDVEPIGAGSDILFYVVAHDATRLDGLCLDDASLFFLTADDTIAASLVVDSDDDCHLPPLVNVIVENVDATVSDGDPVTVNWSIEEGWGDLAGCDRVRIDLIDETLTESCLVIADSTDNDGEFTWTATTCDGPNGPYRIRVTDLASEVIGETSSTFQIISSLGTITVDPNPDQLVAPWALIGPNDFSTTGNGDVELPNLAPGVYTAIWREVDGWNTPEPTAQTLSVGGTATLSGAYIPQPGEIWVRPYPSELDAPWTVSGPNDYSTTLEGIWSLYELEPGEYTVTWGNIPGWQTPDPESQVLPGGGLITLAGTYVLPPESVAINPRPNEIDAPWSIVGPNDFGMTGSGDLVLGDMEMGSYTVTWEEVAGWETPGTSTETLVEGGAVVLTGAYYEPFGRIVIDSNPDELNAPWTLYHPNGSTDGGSGDLAISVWEEGEYGVVWDGISGWETPADAGGFLYEGDTITLTGTYVPQTGTGSISIDPNPDELNAPWTVIDDNDYSKAGNGDVELTDMNPGPYTAIWGEIAGYETPKPVTRSLPEDGAITLTGDYVALPAQCTIVPSKLEFGPVAAGESSSLEFEIQNTGGVALTGEVSTDSGPFEIVSGGGEYVIEVGASHLVTVEFAPPDGGYFQGTISTGCETDNQCSGYGYYPWGDRFCYVTHAWEGGSSELIVVDVSDPANPYPANGVGGGGNTFDVTVYEGHVYVANGGGLSVYNISDPLRPVRTGSGQTTYVGFGVDVRHGIACVADWESGLYVFDVSDPNDVQYMDRFDTPNGARDVAIAGDFVYVAAGVDGLYVIDISDPTDVSLASHWDEHSLVHCVDADWPYAYLMRGDDLKIIDVKDPFNPQEIGSADIAGSGIDIAVRGTLALVSTQFRRPSIIDIPSPEYPVEIAYIEGRSEGICVMDNLAYVTGENGEFYVVDITSPGAPVVVGTTVLQGDSGRLAVVSTLSVR